VVRSIYARDEYKVISRNAFIIPNNDDIHSKKWKTYNRFQKICWYWDYTNRFLMENSDVSIRFEDVISDFEQFNKIILSHGFNLSEKKWIKSINKPKNSSKYKVPVQRLKDAVFRRKLDFDHLPPYSDWTHEQQSMFKEICGNTMQTFKYNL
jgi:hypothetical protein